MTLGRLARANGSLVLVACALVVGCNGSADEGEDPYDVYDEGETKRPKGDAQTDVPAHDGSGGGTVGGAGGESPSGGGTGGGSGGAAGGDPGAGGGSGEGGAPTGALPYPTRSAYRIKGLQPDNWHDRSEIAGNNVGGVALNMVWEVWEKSIKVPPCAPNEEEYDGRCFVVDPGNDELIRDWTARGVVVTGVVYGVPPWARITQCTRVSEPAGCFCAPKDPADYGRFVAMLARRYNGKNGHGRIADFVIHNEVNSNDWYDVGCGKGRPCDKEAWIDDYARNYIAAYDGVMREQSTAKVLISLDHHFGAYFDKPTEHNALLSGESMLTGLARRVGGRAWRVAYHPYAPDLRKVDFSPDDWPRVTYGNLGTLEAWLRMNFPDRPSAWEIQLTESGISSESGEQAQKDAVCRTFQNVLGTPGIENYIYHRLRDHENEGGLLLGLRRIDKSAKPAWEVWAMANRNDLPEPKLSCGFEHLPYVKLTRYHAAGRGHWASTRLPPKRFVEERSWYLYRAHQPGTVMLYECAVPRKGNTLSDKVDCGGLHPLGPVGYIHETRQPNTVKLLLCAINGDYFISDDPGCEGQSLEKPLGYAVKR